MTGTEALVGSIWCGNYPLPCWWDGVGPGGAEDACAAEGVDDVTGLTVLCQRPDGHGGRHMTVFTAPFAGMPAVISCAWPGTTPPCEADLTVSCESGASCESAESCESCEVRPAVAVVGLPDGQALLCGGCLDDAVEIGVVELAASCAVGGGGR